ncbi:MAG: serine/threonine protein kinase [Myxococcales bacterium]|nr:serine/threonine protein kinase [Myxococcales bacterium]
MRWVFVVFVIALLGCGGREATPLRAWTARVDGGAPTPVVLPAHLALAPRHALVELSHDLTIPPAWRGRALDVRVAGWQGATALAVGGRAVGPEPEPSYRARGLSSWRVPAADTRGDTLRLVFTVRHDWEKAAWLDGVPTLELADGGAPLARAETVESIGLVLATGTAFTFAALFGLLFALDRRRREHLWLAVFAATILSYPLFVSGWLAESVGFVEGVAFGVAQVVLAVVGLHLSRATFGAPRPSLVYWVCPLAALAAGALFARPFHTTTFSTFVGAASVAPAFAHLVFLLRLVRARVPRAGLVVATWTLSTAGTLVDGATFFGRGLVPWPGVHVGLASVVLMMVVYGYLLAARHVEFRREVEQLDDDLREQVAARSATLSLAFDRVLAATEGAEVHEGEIVDERYRVGPALGSGGMGCVSLATRLRDGRRVALKVIRGEASALMLARFAREARIASTMSHPNVVRVLDVGVSSRGFLYLVMEHLSGASLAAARDHYGDAAWATAMLRGVVDALVALHARGIVHRDLKPSNVVVVRERGGDVPKVIDFGLAMLSVRAGAGSGAAGADATTRSVLGRADAAGPVGTPLYMAPELVLDGRPASAASDVFALAVMAHVLFVGQTPFGRPLYESGVSLTAARTWGGADPALACVLERALSRDPAERPTASEIARAIPRPLLERYA